VVSSSTLHVLATPFPSPDAYAEIAETHFMTGGEALNSSIVLTRLGWQVRLDGNWVGDSPEGRRLTDIIRACGIDGGRLTAKPDFPGVRELVFSDNQHRTIFGNYVDLLSSERKWNVPQKSDIADARVVCVDPPFREESVLVGTYADELGVPFVSVDCGYDHPLSTLAAAVIVSGEFRQREYPGVELRDLLAEYQARSRGLVILTDGDRQILYGRRGAAVARTTPPRVDVVDSAGAGDSFRAGVIHGMLHGWPDDRTVAYASALAAMVCGRFPGVLTSPAHAEVLRFMEHQNGPS
jgi:sugar/nucleoside kinase (ribokinase family)